MPGETQTYRVETIYDVTDRASRSLGEIEKSARAAAASTHSLKSMIMGLGALHLGSMAIGKAKSLLIDYNASLEQSKSVIAGMLTLYTGAPIDKTWDRAAISVERFQQMAKVSALTTKELVETAQGLTRPLIQVGVKMTDIEKITFGVANAAKAFGMSGSVVALDVEQALRGSVGVRDRFMNSMLAQKGIELSADQFNKMDQSKRINILQKALTSPAISQMAEKQSQTFSGVISTLEDNLSIALGKVGLPLFKAITEEIKGWNAWVDKNGSRIEEIGKSFAHGVMVAFNTIKEIAHAIFPILKEVMSVIVDVMKFAAEHKDVLVGLAKALLVYKIGQTAGRMGMGAISDIGGFAGGLGGSIKAIAESFGGLKSGSTSLVSLFGSLASNLPGVIGGLAKLSIAAYALGGFLLKDTEAEKARKAAAASHILVAGEHQKLTGEVSSIEARMRTFGVEPGQYKPEELVDPTLKKLAARREELLAGKQAAQIATIEEGIKAGMVSETFENGRRKLTLSHGDVEESTIKGHSALMGQLTEIFKEKAVQAAQAHSYTSSMGNTIMDLTWGRFGGPGGILGFFAEEVAKKMDTDIDSGMQANALK